jgi:hypothetical protein
MRVSSPEETMQKLIHCQADVPYDVGRRQFSAAVALYIGALQAVPLQGSQRGGEAAVIAQARL